MERRCSACALPFYSDHEVHFCPDCVRAMPRREKAFCPVCGEIYTGNLEGLCPGCNEQHPPWGRIFFHGIYEGLLRHLILRLKFGGELHLAAALASLLAAHPALLEAKDAYDCIVPVPLHKSRLVERGFNQSGEIARYLAEELGLKTLHALERTRPTHQQVGLSRRERIKNLRGAFSATADTRGKNILLLDDIMTTGATLGFAARSLLKAGAAKVDVVAPARTRARNMLRESRGL